MKIEIPEWLRRAAVSLQYVVLEVPPTTLRITRNVSCDRDYAKRFLELMQAIGPFPIINQDEVLSGWMAVYCAVLMECPTIPVIARHLLPYFQIQDFMPTNFEA
jgi:hypothetical protein